MKTNDDDSDEDKLREVEAGDGFMMEELNRLGKPMDDEESNKSTARKLERKGLEQTNDDEKIEVEKVSKLSMMNVWKSSLIMSSDLMVNWVSFLTDGRRLDTIKERRLPCEIFPRGVGLQFLLKAIGWGKGKQCGPLNREYQQTEGHIDWEIILQLLRTYK